ncbi:HNH endonuclease [Maribacter forsetii]|uniref:HNH endonuclease n=1 Tax=Maribacter forsetii TaxID=444515 RepID=UPI001ADEEB80|nr:HNH endonuclease signature motif containing protein [Maribacter forsetii]
MADEKIINKGWSDDELKASVIAYLDIQRRIKLGEKPVKKAYYTKLSEDFGRSLKSFEYRMQNISYVMLLLGRDWISGLTPMANVGANIAKKIENILADIENRESNPVVEFEAKVKAAIGRKKLLKPSGKVKPKKGVSIINNYERDYMVKAWVLKNAAGKCEYCNNAAPFETSGGLPYLEVHHVISLAESGPDIVENTVALCPNCHREAHYGTNKKKLKAALYNSIKRLAAD